MLSGADVQHSHIQVMHTSVCSRAYARLCAPCCSISCKYGVEIRVSEPNLQLPETPDLQGYYCANRDTTCLLVGV
jgi:hypothetical protein